MKSYNLIDSSSSVSSALDLSVRYCAKLVLMCLVSALVLTACSSTSGVSRLQGQEAPVTRYYMLDGQTISLDQLRGKNVVILFWATTCTFSRTVVERLADFAGRYGASKNVEVIAVSVDKLEDQEKLKERIKSSGLEAMKHAFSGNDVHDETYIAFEVESLPTIAVIDPQGKVVASGGSDDVVYEYFKVS